MGLEINLNMNIELTGGDLKQLITEWAEKKVPGHVVKSVDFQVQDCGDDRFGRGYANYQLTKAVVHMMPKPAPGVGRGHAQ